MGFHPMCLYSKCSVFEENPIVGENQIGPNMNTDPVQRYVRDGRASAIGRFLAQTPVGSVCRAVGRIRDTMGQFLFLFFFCFFFALTLSPLLGIPENLGVM